MWTQQELCTRSGVSYGSIRRIESGDRVADVAQVDRLARAFGMSASAFVRLAEGRASAES